MVVKKIQPPQNLTQVPQRTRQTALAAPQRPQAPRPGRERRPSVRHVADLGYN